MDRSGRGVWDRWWSMALVILIAPFVMAHHPSYPAPLELELLGDESADGDWVLVTTPGFVRQGSSTQLICKEAFGATGPLYSAVLGPTHYAMATPEGLAVTRDGCDVDHFHPLPGWVADVAGRGDDRIAAVVDVADGSEVFWSVDGGTTLQGPIETAQGIKITGVDWIDDRRLVATAFDDDASLRGAAVALSADLDQAGVDWEYHHYGDDLRYAYLFATGENSQGTGIIVAALRQGADPLLVWGPVDDPGRHRVELSTWPLNADVGPGGQVYVAPISEEWHGAARAEDGVLHHDQRLTGQDVRCVVDDGQGLFICSSGVSEDHELWRLKPDQPQEPIYRLADLEGARSDCPDHSAVAQICPERWELIKDTIPRRPLADEEDGEEEQEEQGEEEQDDGMPGWFEDHLHDDSPQSGDDTEPGEEDGPGQRRCSGSGGGTATVWLTLLFLLGLRLVGVIGLRWDRQSQDLRETPDPSGSAEIR